MLKRNLAFLVLFILALPLTALATNWTLTTKVATLGGKLNVNGAPDQLSGLQKTVSFASPPVGDVPVVVTANPGYKIAAVVINGVQQPLPIASPATFLMGLGQYPARLAQTLTAYFTKETYTVTVTAGPGGTAGPTQTANLNYGVIKDFVFSPYAGNKVVRIENLDGLTYQLLDYNTNAPLSALPGATDQKVKVRLTVTQSVTMNGVFLDLIVEAGISQTVLFNTPVTLGASAEVNDNSTVSYAWSQISGPAVTLANADTATPSFTAGAVVSEYGFKVTATTDSGLTGTDTIKVYVFESAVAAGFAQCQVCHEQNGVGTQTDAYNRWAVSTHATEVVMCYNCHVGADTGAHPGTMPTSSTCATCHQETGTDYSGSVHATKPSVFGAGCIACHVDHTFVPDPALCYNCHAANPSSTHAKASLATFCARCHNPHTTSPLGGDLSSHVGGQFNGTTAQYLRKGGDCIDCHANNDITANALILAEFAGSGHGDVNSPAWITTSSHDWPTGSCKGCHSTTGFIDSVTGVTTAVTAGEPGQVLACNACHVSVVTGEVRDPGAYTANYTANSITTTYEFPDAGPSNLCLNCHSGRRSGAQVSEAATTTPHYLAAGGTLFNAIGYEFAGQVYDGIGYHRTVGIADNLGSGNAGPCVACHMSSSAGHSWEVVTTDAGGNITGITSSACAACHSDMTAGKLNGKKADFRAALDALTAVLAAKGIHYYNGSFYTAPYVEEGTNTSVDNAYYGTVAANIDGANGVLPPPSKRDLQGASFNLYLFDHSDPAAYVHNRGYAFRLIADSIDLFSDGVVNNDVTPAIQAVDLSQSVRDAAINAIRNPETWTHSTMSESAASPTVCGGCHDAAPHYNGIPFIASDQDPAPRAQFMAQNLDCLDCHASDAFTRSEVNVEFAQSGHGNVNGEAWKHLDWAVTSASPAEDRSTCQRCHTTTGLLNDVTGSATVLATGAPGQVLACSGCHEAFSATGVRQPDPFQATFTNDHSKSLIIPDCGTSNICVRCHSGQSGGSTITSSSENFSNLAFIQPHYLAAAGTMFRTGYHFSPLTYPNPGANHTGIGGGDGGPCAHCHMVLSDVELPIEVKHTLDVVARDSDGTITAITTGVCSATYCHASFTPADVNNKAFGYAAALEALKARLAAREIHYYPIYPYFYTEANGAGVAVTDWTRGGTINGKALMGAAFNFSMLMHEPGGYAHNPTYVRRLIFDSINFLDNGLLGATIDLTDYPAAAYYLKPIAPVSAVTRP